MALTSLNVGTCFDLDIQRCDQGPDYRSQLEVDMENSKMQSRLLVHGTETRIRGVHPAVDLLKQERS
jgi:hypothetical protein